MFTKELASKIKPGDILENLRATTKEKKTYAATVKAVKYIWEDPNNPDVWTLHFVDTDDKKWFITDAAKDVKLTSSGS